VSRAFGYDTGEAFHMPRAMKRRFDLLSGVGSLELTAAVQQLVHVHSAITVEGATQLASSGHLAVFFCRHSPARQSSLVFFETTI